MTIQLEMTCEECGRPATTVVQDLFDDTIVAYDTVRHYTPAGAAHAYCDVHARNSQIIDVQMSGVFMSREQYEAVVKERGSTDDQT